MPFVFRYKVYNITSDEVKVAPSYATEQYIEKIEGAQVLRETRRDVSDEQLDGDGRLKVLL